ncbi:MAG: hypothetical protein SF052_12485 [Bacteroidia bacterium]|nr:hypothetical protein [Bacteroidia bacterium]
MNLSFTYSPAWIFLIVILAAGLTWLMYRETKGLLPATPRLLLGIFRFLVLTTIGILLLQPLISSFSKITFAPIVAVLQDNSESLVIQKDSSFVRSEYPGKLSEFMNAFPDKDYQTDLYAFSSDIKSSVSPDSLKFDQTGTNISQGIKEIQDLYQNQNLGAIVLISDGITTAGISPLYALEGVRQPVYTVLLGDTTARQDVRIKEVLFNEIAYMKNEMPIKVKVQSVGYDQADLKVTLSSQGKVLGSQSVTLGGDKQEGEVSFFVLPEAPGLRQYIVQVSRMQNEITYRNNTAPIFVNVLETRVKIALFAGSPHPDLGALTKAFERDDSYEVTSFVLKQPGVFYTSPTAYNLQDFDLFVLHNFPQSALDAKIVTEIAGQIKDNKKPVIFFTGMFTDLRTLAPLFEYMAITPKNFTQKAEEVIANFKPEYRSHSTYTFTENWIQWANSAPPVFRNQSNWEAKSTAEVFATAKIKNIALDYPVYALQNYLGRKNMVFLGENFWRMRAHSYLESSDFELFDAWLFNNIKYLMVSDDKRKFRVAPAKKIFTGSEPVIFKGQVYDDSYNPVPDVEIKLTMTAPDGKQNDYYLNETGQAQYFLELYNLAEGTYNYVAEGRKNEVPVGTDRGQFSIGKSNVEHFQLQADRDLMQQIALRTGGEFIYARNLSELPDKIKALPALKPVVDFKKANTPFNQFGWVLVLLLILLSVEWIVRKLYSLL